MSVSDPVVLEKSAMGSFKFVKNYPNISMHFCEYLSLKVKYPFI
jgi:hypothetical protein